MRIFFAFLARTRPAQSIAKPALTRVRGGGRGWMTSLPIVQPSRRAGPRTGLHEKDEDGGQDDPHGIAVGLVGRDLIGQEAEASGVQQGELFFAKGHERNACRGGALERMGAAELGVRNVAKPANGRCSRRKCGD